MAEVASAFVTLIPSARGFGKATANEIDGDMQKAGKSSGGKMSGALGAAFKKGTKFVGVAAAAGIGTALFKGFQRLSAIEEAEAKLKGLGNSTKTVKSIMDNALAAVKGTAFGLGDAATVAAGAVASGIKPGRALEKNLTLVADAATISGSSMSEMGSIFNKVAASGKLQGDVIAQLGDRGIPILQLLGKEIGKTPAEVSKLASQGKIDFKTFSKAMDAGLGGAAQKSGKTFSGALANMNAALGRLGASVLKGVFPQMAGGFGSVTRSLDKAGPAAERVGVKLGELASNIGPLVKSLLPAVGTAFKTIGETGKVILPLATGIAKGFNSLDGGAKKVILLAGAIALLGPKLSTAADKFKNFDAAGAASTAKAAALRVGIGALGVGLVELGSKAGGAKTSVGSLLTVAGATAVGFAAGGPFGAALGAAGSVMSIFTSRSQAAADAQAKFKGQVASVTATLNQQTGAFGATTRATVAKTLADTGAFTAGRKVGVSYRDVLSAALGNAAATKRVDAATGAYISTQDRNINSLQKAGKTVDTLRGAVHGTTGAIADQRNKIDQVNAAMGKLDGKKANVKVTADTGGFFGPMRDVINSINNAAAKASRIKVGENANGTDNWRGGMTWVGENGPELINLAKGAQVIPNHKIGDGSGRGAALSVGSTSAAGLTRDDLLDFAEALGLSMAASAADISGSVTDSQSAYVGQLARMVR